MTLVEQKIQEFEQRSAASMAAEELACRKSTIDHFTDISRFEGLTANEVDQRLFDLYSENKITKQEYLELCLLDAHNHIS